MNLFLLKKKNSVCKCQKTYHRLCLSDQVEGLKQFIGSVTNVKLFEDDKSNDIRNMTKGLCDHNSNFIQSNVKWETF